MLRRDSASTTFLGTCPKRHLLQIDEGAYGASMKSAPRSSPRRPNSTGVACVVDATACVSRGGSRAFAGGSPRVVSIELNMERSRMLAHNITHVRRFERLGRVDVVQGDCLEKLPTLGVELVVDPGVRGPALGRPPLRGLPGRRLGARRPFKRYGHARRLRRDRRGPRLPSFIAQGAAHLRRDAVFGEYGRRALRRAPSSLGAGSSRSSSVCRRSGPRRRRSPSSKRKKKRGRRRSRLGWWSLHLLCLGRATCGADAGSLRDRTPVSPPPALVFVIFVCESWGTGLHTRSPVRGASASLKRHGRAGSNRCGRRRARRAPSSTRGRRTRKYFPLGAFSGFAATRPAITGPQIREQLLFPKLNLPQGACKTPSFGLGPQFHAAFLELRDERSKESASSASVPSFFAAGSNPFGPSTRARVLAFQQGRHVGRRDARVELHVPVRDAVHQVLAADDVRAGRLCHSWAVGSSEDAATTTPAADAVRQAHDAAHRLQRLARVDVQHHVEVDGLVEPALLLRAVL